MHFCRKTTEQFMRAQVSETYDIKSWAKGKGDVYMQAIFQHHTKSRWDV